MTSDGRASHKNASIDASTLKGEMEMICCDTTIMTEEGLLLARWL